MWTGILEPDPKRTFAWLLKCYELLPVAEVGNMIARRYVCGEGSERNPEKAKEYYIKGMLQNDETAQTELASLLRVLREQGEQAETRSVQRECMCELFRRCGVKFKD